MPLKLLSMASVRPIATLLLHDLLLTRRPQDYPYLRELQRQDLGKNDPLRHFKMAQTPSQSRPFLTQTLARLQLSRLQVIANAQPTNPQAQEEFLQALYDQRQYAAVLERVQNPAFKHLTLSPTSWQLYLQTAQQHTHTTNLQLAQNLLPRLVEQGILSQESASKIAEVPKSQQAAQLFQMVLRGNAGSTTTTGVSMAGQGGLSPQTPLHVSVTPTTPSLRATIVSFVARAALVVLAFSAVGALLDERGLRGATGFGDKKHVNEATESKTRFDDVKGVDEAKAELQEIVLYLKDPSRFTRLGGKLPRGVLLTGPPGTGKTLLAKAIAGEAGVPFFYSSGSQFEEVYVGLGAKRIRELFETAAKKAPAIVFIDEIDAVGGSRKLKDQSALKMTLNELLVQLDGFDENNGIIVIGATNFMESLDSALLRPGRFDKHVTVPLPDVGGRQQILEMYAQKTKLDADVDLDVLARGTTGFSGADLYNLMNQAALKASVDGLNAITMSVLEYAKDKILMGAERKTAVISPETARCTAFHEAGHALVAVLTQGAMPIHKATIMPRGNALGMVTMLPEGDQTSQSYKEMLASMDVAMGGRVAEELTFGPTEVTSGASSDIRQATRTARNMVTKFGFSSAVGIVFHGGSSGEESASAETRTRIDAEVKRLTDESYQRAKDLLSKYAAEHKLLAETLLEYETLTGDEVRDLIQHRKKPSRPIIAKGGDDKKEEEKKKKKAIGRGRLFG